MAAASAAIPKDMKDKFARIVTKTHKEQAIWFLNGFWEIHNSQAETVWTWVHKFEELDPKKTEGCDLDEFNAHRFLEFFGETLTVKEMRERLRVIDIDFNNRMAMAEFLIFRYHISVPDLVNAPQGDNKEEMAKAQGMMDEATSAVEAMTLRLQEQHKAVLEQSAKEGMAHAAAQEAKKTAEKAKQAENEQKASLNALQKEEAAYAAQIATLEGKSAGAGVSAKKAAAELAQLKAADPMPLQKAKITQSATVRAAEKATKAAADAASAAEAAAAAAAAARVQAEEMARQAEASVSAAEAKLHKAQAYLDEVKMKPGHSFGNIWWMERELAEKKKYLPKSKQK
jgi:Ca2+-binding EF-hand superfamily protein